MIGKLSLVKIQFYIDELHFRPDEITVSNFQQRINKFKNLNKIEENTSVVDENGEDVSVVDENREKISVVAENKETRSDGMMEKFSIIDSTFVNQILTVLLPPHWKTKKQKKREKAAEIPKWIGLTLNFYNRFMHANPFRSQDERVR